MARTHASPERETGDPEDLPRGLIQLARHIARDCVNPGTYTITLEVPKVRGQPQAAEISRIEKIRILKIRQN